MGRIYRPDTVEIDVTTLNEILAIWDSGEGKPYKGKLIDWDSYTENPANNGCMCAQGQVLHLLGGWKPNRLLRSDQKHADKAVAKLLNISVAHAILLRHVNDRVVGAPSIVLTDPEKVLGSEWSKLLDFWCALDAMSVVAWNAAGHAARDVAWASAWDVARAATIEIQGRHLLKTPPFFLPMFGFKTADDIPPRPADYGVSRHV